MGGDYQQIFATTFNDVGTNQIINLGTPSHNPGGIDDSDFPNSNATIRANARSIFANLVGNLNSSSATVNVETPTSGFVLGATRSRLFRQRDLALYLQDQWRARSNLTLNLGVRWDYMGVPTIPNGLAIQLLTTVTSSVYQVLETFLDPMPRTVLHPLSEHSIS